MSSVSLECEPIGSPIRVNDVRVNLGRNIVFLSYLQSDSEDGVETENDGSLILSHSGDRLEMSQDTNSNFVCSTRLRNL